QWPALRRALVPRLHHAVIHDPAVQIRPDQTDYAVVIDAFAQAVDQSVVVDPVEELGQIHVNHDPPPRLDIRLSGQYRILRTPARTEAVAVLAKSGVDPGLQHL